MGGGVNLSKTDRISAAALFTLTFILAGAAQAHGIAAGDQGFIEQTSGPQIAAFLYLGAKHMVTGYDHLLFLFGVIFFLYRMRDVALYVTLFAIGHSTTLIAGVLIGTHVSAHLVDAVIGLSIVYKALDNLGAWRSWFGVQPDTRAAVLFFGFVHGFGLATKLQDFALSSDGLLTNLISFNIGVEVGQLLALAAILIAMGFWRRTASFTHHAVAANILLMMAGFILFGLQMTGYFLEG